MMTNRRMRKRQSRKRQSRNRTRSQVARSQVARSEVAGRVNFSGIRYAQCWEDADILLEALAIQPGHVCLSIASAGDNALAMLSRGPQRLVALDLSAAQIACLELRVAAYRELEHSELLQLLGSRPSRRRAELYYRCRALLSSDARRFWDAQPAAIAQGVGGAGKFERYFALFRRGVLPLIHPSRRVARLLRRRTPRQREMFYDAHWNSWRWRLLFRLFCSRPVLGRLGRDPRFFRYVEGDVAGRIMERIRHALTALDPCDSPYLQWVLLGHHAAALPYALRAENFEAIRRHLDRLEWRCQSLEEYLCEVDEGSIDRFNLSDIFEYMSPAHYEKTLRLLVRAGRSGARLAYWNMLVPRRRPPCLAHRLRPLDELSERLHARDQAIFYSAFVVEEII